MEVVEERVESPAGRTLSPEELFLARSCDHKIPQRTHGQKDFIPDNSEEQAEKLQVCQEEQWQLLSEERVERLGSLIKAEWKPQEGIVELKSNAGKFWHTMGHVEEGKQLLYPEEALYLLECGSIQLYYRDQQLSIQEAYEVLLSTRTIPLEQYQVYSHLKRLGYIVMRFDSSTVCSSHEQKLHLDPSCSDTDTKHWKRKRSGSHDDENLTLEQRSKKSHSDQPEEAESGQSVGEGEEQCKLHQQDVTCKDTEKEVSKPTPVSPESNMKQLQENSVVGCSDMSKQRAELKKRGWFQFESLDSTVSSPWSSQERVIPAGKSRWDFTKIKFPNIAVDCPEVKLNAPDQSLLPPNVVARAWHWKNSQMFQNLSKSKKKKMRKNMCKADSNKNKQHKQYSNWKEYKEMLRTKNAQGKKLPAHLWRDKMEPLVKPSQVSSLGEIQQSICIMESAHILDKTPRLQEISESIRISFDVYQADTVAKFRKTNPGKPFSRMCVCSFDGPVPDLRVMKKLAFQSGAVPVVFAVVDNGDISFYTFKEFKLPVDIIH
ncbi:tRNA-splicing endonuclease subunit Sen54 isoform X1 [Hemitrygon akajei]|uniref:tRNA-splicing endonuclease subunit Sen54 isoform X1 n=2 Tax=Hemitrygon akajei TaxID=2704970 RepID=UPI003BF98828